MLLRAKYVTDYFFIIIAASYIRSTQAQLQCRFHIFSMPRQSYSRRETLLFFNVYTTNVDILD